MSCPRRVCGNVLRYASDRGGCSGYVRWGSGPHLFGMDIERTAAGNPWGLEPLLDVKELAGYLHVPVSTVYDWRTRGFGPRAYRFGKHLKFAVSDVRDWIEQQHDNVSLDLCADRVDERVGVDL